MQTDLWKEGWAPITGAQPSLYNDQHSLFALQ